MNIITVVLLDWSCTRRELQGMFGCGYDREGCNRGRGWMEGNVRGEGKRGREGG